MCTSLKLILLSKHCVAYHIGQSQVAFKLNAFIWASNKISLFLCRTRNKIGLAICDKRREGSVSDTITWRKIDVNLFVTPDWFQTDSSNIPIHLQPVLFRLPRLDIPWHHQTDMKSVSHEINYMSTPRMIDHAQRLLSLRDVNEPR